MKITLSRFSLLITVIMILTLTIIFAVGSPIAGLAHTVERDDTLTPLSTQNDLCTVVSSPVNPAQLSSNHSPWTDSRMRAAEPYPLPIFIYNPTATAPQQFSGDPVFIPGEPPDDFSPASQQQIPGTLSAEALLGYTYPAPYTRYENFDDYTRFPYSTTGVLFFSQNGRDFRCSAASIGNNALWTAGHCVHDGSGSTDGWSSDFLFAPAYKDGSMPFGSWTSNQSATCSGWKEDGNFQVDFGGVLLEENTSGKEVDEVVGSLGFAYNLNPNQHWFSLGYPSQSPFDGKTMQICAASFARNDAGFGFPFPIAIGCDQTRGSSGGPWIINFSGSQGNTNYINGNNSYRYIGFGEEMYSPYFGEQAKELLNFLSNETRLRTNIHIPIVVTGD
jgi:V8-like Glu-specific endopeptidase